MTKVKLDLLLKAAEDLNEVFGLKPEIYTDVDLIEKNLEDGKYDSVEEYLTDHIKKAAELAEPEDEFKANTIAVWQDMGVWMNQEVEEDEEVKDEEEVIEDSLEDQIKNAATLRDLKDIAKSNDEFKNLRGKLSKYDDVDDLMDDMLNVLKPPKAVEPKPAPKKPKTKKKDEKPAKAEKTKKEKTSTKKSTTSKEGALIEDYWKKNYGKAKHKGIKIANEIHEKNKSWNIDKIYRIIAKLSKNV